MTHRLFQELMTDAIDGRLSSEDAVRFDALLEESSEHQREWVAFQEMRERLLAVGPEAPPPGLAARIRASIHEERARDGAASSPSPAPVDDSPLEPSRWSHLHRMGWLRAAAVFVLLALATPIVLQTWKARRPSTTAPATTMEAEAETEDEGLYQSEELEDDLEVSEEMALGSSARRSRLTTPPPGTDRAAPKGAAGEEPFRLKGLTPPPASEADKEQDEAGAPLSKYADLMENRLRQLESGQPGKSVPVVEEAMLYFGQSLAQFSREELQSRGVSSLRRALVAELSAGRARNVSGTLFKQGRSRDAQGADGASGRVEAEKKLYEEARGRPPVAKPKAAPRGGGGSARPPKGVVGGSVPSPSNGKVRGVPERQFLTVMGKGAGTRMGRLFEHWPAARELPLQGGLSTPAGDKSDRSPPITSVGRDEKPAAGLKPKAQGAAGYSIFEVTLPIAHADAFVRSLAQESSLSLRFIGPSRPAVAEPGSGRLPELQTKVSIEQVIQNAASSRGVGEQRTLVLIVLDQ